MLVTGHDLSVDQGLEQAVAARLRKVEGAADLGQADRNSGLVKVEEDIEGFVDGGGSSHSSDPLRCAASALRERIRK